MRVVIGVVLFFSLALPSSSVSEQEQMQRLSNERFQTAPKWIEAQWGVDCVDSVNAVLAIADEQMGLTIPLDLSQALQRCALIYNTRGTDHYRPCPDYGKVLSLSKQSSAEAVSVSSLRRLLSSSCVLRSD